MQDRQKAVGKLLMERDTLGMKAVAERYGLSVAGKIDLRESRVRFNHTGLDLREFLLEGCDLSGSVLTNCVGEEASFRRCVMKRVRITAEKAAKVSFRKASFDEATLEDASFGPRTLDLSATTFRKAAMRDVTFQMGKLQGASFEGAVLQDVLFRSAELKDVSFREAALTRVSFEKATLQGADFTGAVFRLMEHWGEPDFEGATISDDLRYAYGIVREPMAKIAALLDSGQLDADEVSAIRQFQAQNADFLANPEVMLILSESDLDPLLFVKMMKALKQEVVH